MMYKKEYAKPESCVVLIEPITLLTASFTETIDDEDPIDDSDLIL